MSSEDNEEWLPVDDSAQSKTPPKTQKSKRKRQDAPPNDTSKRSKSSIEQVYQKKTQLEHILLRPDTYVGSIEPITQSMWVLDDVTKRMMLRKVPFVPGLFKIFDEILVNACDNKQRDPKGMTTLRVTIDPKKNEIAVWNDGQGIPIVLHKEHLIHVPELIFGHLLTGSNFDDHEKKTTGGRNGYGAKLANIFSTRFQVETADASNKKLYRQVFSHNMTQCEPPDIKTWTRKSEFTCITFQPDLAKFQLRKLDDDTIAVFKKRVIDIAGVTPKSLQVYWNDALIEVPSFPDYVALYGAVQVVVDKPTERWQVAVGLSDDGFQQVSFVNGICTSKGGQHVQYVTDQVIAHVLKHLKKNLKHQTTVKPAYIKNHLMVFVAALIDNPAFDSQTKETLTTRSAAFGSTYTISDKFFKQIKATGLMERVLAFTEFKQTSALRRKAAAAGSSGHKHKKLTGIPKLDDANYAGTSKAHDCTLIVTEGDSAKALAIGGLAVVGRDYYGVFPLKGKLLNVREASHAQILKNEELQHLVKILGLKYGHVYDHKSIKTLRYGHLMIMADQDYDGSHIKGLVINWMHHFWPSLLKIDGFLQEFITPIVKCTRHRETRVFYTIPAYQHWRNGGDRSGWQIKYYKGLGTSTTAEVKTYFNDLNTHQITFAYAENDGDRIDMAFSKKRVDERKAWLRGFQEGNSTHYQASSGFKIADFVDQELILFSRADNLRSIPSVIDGLKPSQRKVLFCCFKRNLVKEIKVAQLAGYVSEHSAYHHGEQSLHGTIINMAQDFVGSNNLNVLSPNGQFGTRLMGGKDAASPRYIFTVLEAITRLLFSPLDHETLKYLEDDGQLIEPAYYVPILPMVLVNGSDGIGTGWSSSVPNYNPLDLITILRQKLRGAGDPKPLVPWYRGFQGTILEKSPGSGTFLVQGKYEIPESGTLVISELPVKTWTQSYKQFLEIMLENETILDFKENHTDIAVFFTITMDAATLDQWQQANEIWRKFKLETTISTSNMHLFDANGQITKYERPEEILDAFYDVRLEFYAKRKHLLLEKLHQKIQILENKTRFLLAIIEGELIVNNRSKQDLLLELQRQQFDCMDRKKLSSKDEEDRDEEEEEDENHLSRGFDYLLSMKLWNLTKEKVETLQQELKNHQLEYQTLQSTRIETLWERDLDAIEAAIHKCEQQISEKQQSKIIKRKPSVMKRKKKKTVGSDEEEEDSDYEVAAKAKDVGTRRKSERKATKKPVKEEVIEIEDDDDDVEEEERKTKSTTKKVIVKEETMKTPPKKKTTVEKRTRKRSSVKKEEEDDEKDAIKEEEQEEEDEYAMLSPEVRQLRLETQKLLREIRSERDDDVFAFRG